MTDTKYSIEIATTDYRSTQAAVAGGADRIELCSALSEGGLTPSFGLIEQSRKDFGVALFPIIRPRSGDFLYTDEEYAIIKKDALLCKKMGCDGVVIGFLNEDGSIDKKRVAQIVELVYPLEVTFHRAFDRCKDPFVALEELINLGCQRILTSGQQPTALQGAELIRQLIEAANNRVVIMPGSGVRIDNIHELAKKTGAVEFHTSLKTKGRSAMQFIHPAFASSEESYSHATIQAEDVTLLRSALLMQDNKGAGI
jgi:copper homeostasis protein